MFKRVYVTTGDQNRKSVKTPCFVFLMLLYSILTLIMLIGCSSSALIETTALREAKRIIAFTDSSITLYIHGSGDTPFGWAKDKERRYGGVAIDWTDASHNKLRAAKNGYAIGKRIASTLIQADDKKSITLIAHSAGAWVAQGIADVVNDKERMRIVFLDPFTASSILTPFAGSKMLGEHAKEVITYYTTIDPIPFTSGKVSSGELINVDERIVIKEKKREAHWDIINLYFSTYH